MSNPLKLALINSGQYDPAVEDELTQLITAIQGWANSGKVDITSYLTAAQPRCRYMLLASQNIANNTDTSLLWPGPAKKADSITSSVTYDNGADYGGQPFAPVGATEWLIPPVPGNYLVIAGVAFAAAAAGQRQIWLQQRDESGGIFDIGGTSHPVASAAALSNLQVSAVITIPDRSLSLSPTFQPGVRVRVYQNSGGLLAAFNGFGSTYVNIIKLS